MGGGSFEHLHVTENRGTKRLDTFLRAYNQEGVDPDHDSQTPGPGGATLSFSMDYFLLEDVPLLAFLLL